MLIAATTCRSRSVDRCSHGYKAGFQLAHGHCITLLANNRQLLTQAGEIYDRLVC